MFSYMAYRIRLYRLQRQLRANDKWYTSASTGLTGDALQEINAEAGSTYFRLQEEVDHLVTQRLLGHAAQLLVETPDTTDESCWQECHCIMAYRVLTRKGIRELRSAIRAERTARNKLLLPWLTGLTGLAGALTGMLAVILS